MGITWVFGRWGVGKEISGFYGRIGGWVCLELRFRSYGTSGARSDSGGESGALCTGGSAGWELTFLELPTDRCGLWCRVIGVEVGVSVGWGEGGGLSSRVTCMTTLAVVEVLL